MTLDANVVGAGPNGLAAGIALAQAGRSVRLYEAEHTIGGGTRSAELTLPGYTHDVCAAVHALALASPFLKTLPLAKFGFQLIQPDVPFAHPLDDGTAVLVHRSITETADALSRRDARAYRRLMGPFVERADRLMDALLGPIGLRHPLLMARFGLHAARSAEAVATGSFADERTRALFAGVSAHSMVPLDKMGTAGYALGLLVSAHAYGWPVAHGGSQRLADAMAALFTSLGGEIVTNSRVASLDQLPPSRAVLCDVTPRQLLRMAGERMPRGYGRRLAAYRYGPGVFKMDWALSEPVPWRSNDCRRAGTLHLGGFMQEISLSERDAWDGRVSERPYVLVVQPSVFDATRAPAGKHTLWAYCHVPHGSTADMRERIERQIERFAPGFRDCITARNMLFPADMERRNANLVGGDIGGGAGDFSQILMRPVASLNQYATALSGVYLCSSSTPPGIGVHGMCGYYGAGSRARGTAPVAAGVLVVPRLSSVTDRPRRRLGMQSPKTGLIMSSFRIAALAAVSIALAACSDSMSTPGGPAGLRVINATGTAVDVLVDGHVAQQAVGVGTVTAGIPVSAGSHQLTIRGTGGDSATLTVQPSVGESVTATAVRTGATNAISAAVLVDTGSVVPAGKSKLKVVHLAANAGAIEIFRTQPDFQTPVHIMTPFNYGDQSPYLQSDPGNWTVFVTAAGSTTPIATTGPVNVPAGERRTVVLMDSAGVLKFRIIAN